MLQVTQIIPFSKNAVLVNWRDEMSPEINNEVHVLADYLSENAKTTFLIPAYASLTIGYNPSDSSYISFASKLWSLIRELSPDLGSRRNRLNIPVCYHDTYALDLEEVTTQTGLKKREIIERHSGRDYRVYFMGFLPGFGYLGELDEELSVFRKSVPRTKIEAGSVGLANRQTGIYPIDAPGGWQVIGKTPIPLIDNLASKEAFLLRSGDTIKFYAIELEEYSAWKDKVRLKTTSIRNLLLQET